MIRRRGRFFSTLEPLSFTDLVQYKDIPTRRRRHPSGFVWRRGRISGMAYSNPTFLSRPRHSISDKTPAIYFFQLTAPCRDLWLNNRSPPKNLSNKICHDTPVQLKLIYNIRCLFYSRFKRRINKNYNRWNCARHKSSRHPLPG